MNILLILCIRKFELLTITINFCFYVEKHSHLLYNLDLKIKGKHQFLSFQKEYVVILDSSCI